MYFCVRVSASAPFCAPAHEGAARRGAWGGPPAPPWPSAAAVGPAGGGPGGGIDWGHQDTIQSPKRLHKALEGTCALEHLRDLQVVPHPPNGILDE